MGAIDLEVKIVTIKTQFIEIWKSLTQRPEDTTEWYKQISETLQIKSKN